MTDAQELDLSTWLPLNPVSYLILMSVARGPRHGYGIVKEIAADSDGAVELHPGNLYRYLRRLEDDGFVCPAEPPEDEEDARRAYVVITELGRKVLAAETRRLKSLIRTAELTSLGVESRGGAPSG